MTILQSLKHRYDRLVTQGKLSPPGFAPSQISFTFVLSEVGQVVTVNDERSADKQRRPRMVWAPQAPNDRRGERIVAGSFWDPADYAIGIPRPDPTGSALAAAKLSRKAIEKFAAFKQRHVVLLSDSDDEGCRALLRFLEWWAPDKISALPYASDVPGGNIAFRLHGENGFIHDRQAARDLLSAEAAGGEARLGMCLVTGLEAPIARLHIPIKGIGDKLAPLVSFNEDAFTSYGREKGANAPVSVPVAFGYATALNALVASSGTTAKGRPTYSNRVTLGETTVAFWAERADAESLVRALLDPSPEEVEGFDGSPNVDETTEGAKLSGLMARMQDGRPLREEALEMDPLSRVYILGLSPNSARLAVRFWVEQSLGDFAGNFQRHWADIAIDPPPWGSRLPSARYLLAKTTVRATNVVREEEYRKIPPVLGGGVMRAILAGTPYPRTWLTATLMRLRAGDAPRHGWHAAAIKAVITRSGEEAVPMGLDPDNPSEAYQLGRLFAVLESAQREAPGVVNASIADRYYGVASSAPAHIFGQLLSWTFRILGRVERYRMAQKISSDAMNRSASSSGKTVRPNGPALVHRSFHRDQ